MASDHHKSRRKQILRWLPGVIISIVAIVVILQFAEWSEIKDAFLHFRLWHILVSLFLLYLALLTRAQAWKIMLGDEAPYWTTFFTVCVGYLLNSLFPLRLGEASRVIMIRQSTRLGGLHVLSSIVIERAFDLAITALMLLVSLIFVIDAEWAQPIGISTLVLTIVGLFVLAGVVRYPEKVQAVVEKLGSRIKPVEKYLLPRLSSLITGLGALSSPGRFFASLFWMVITWALYLAVYFFLLRQIAPDATLWWAMFGQSVVALGAAIPSAPGGMGIFEAAVVGSLTILGVNASDAFAFGLVLHAIDYFVLVSAGMVGVGRLGHSLSSLLAEIRNQNAAQDPNSGEPQTDI